jgi:hypothetical protein
MKKKLPMSGRNTEIDWHALLTQMQFDLQPLVQNQDL